MGKGKGSPEMWVAVVKPGRVMFELEGVSLEIAQKALALASAKMPVKTQVRRARGGAHRCELTDIRELSGRGGGVEASLELEEELFRLNFRSATEPLEDPLRLRWIRKDIARLKTILRERQLESAR